jgi:hypothetical protein
MNAKHTNVVNPLLTFEQIDALLRELAEDVLAFEGLESFPTVTTPKGGTPTVITVSRLSRFHSGMGLTSITMGMCMVSSERLRRGNSSVDEAPGHLVYVPGPCG